MGLSNATPSGISHQYPLQRSAINRPNHLRRSIGSAGSKSLRKSPTLSNPMFKQSSQKQEISHPSNRPSTTTKSPGGLTRGGTTSPIADVQAQKPPQSSPPNRNHPSRRHSGLTNTTSAPPPLRVVTANANARDERRSSELDSGSTNRSTYYASPFQTHIEQLGKLSRPFLFHCSLV